MKKDFLIKKNEIDGIQYGIFSQKRDLQNQLTAAINCICGYA